MLIPKPNYQCITCGGKMTLQKRYKTDTKLTFRNAKDNVTVTRITEEWRCHNGHIHLVNKNEEPKLIIND